MNDHLFIFVGEMRKRDVKKIELVKEKALEIIIAKGFEGFTMNKLARECNISVATLYIYYKDKEDLIIQLAEEKGREMKKAILMDFDSDLSFEEGLRIQWRNRYRHIMDSPGLSTFFEQLRNSVYLEKFTSSFIDEFKNAMGQFIENSIKRGEINEMTLEVYWSVAFAPLYNLIRFHNEGHSLARKPFKLKDEMVWETFNLIIKALKK